MKTLRIMYVFTFFLSSVVWGQSIGTISTYAQPISLPDHPAHAELHDMRPEVNLSGGTMMTAQGERPLWEAYKPAPEVSLGAFARDYRKGHAVSKAVVFSNQ